MTNIQLALGLRYHTIVDRSVIRWRRSASQSEFGLGFQRIPSVVISGRLKRIAFLFTRSMALHCLPILTLLVLHLNLPHPYRNSFSWRLFVLLFFDSHPLFPFFFIADHVFDESSTNASVYDLLTNDIINAAVEGFNGMFCSVLDYCKLYVN